MTKFHNPGALRRPHTRISRPLLPHQAAPSRSHSNGEGVTRGCACSQHELNCPLYGSARGYSMVNDQQWRWGSCCAQEAWYGQAQWPEPIGRSTFPMLYDPRFESLSEGKYFVLERTRTTIRRRRDRVYLLVPRSRQRRFLGLRNLVCEA